MAESIVYEHPNFKFTNNINSAQLVQWKDQVILVEWDDWGIQVKNLDTQKSICEILYYKNTDLEKINDAINTINTFIIYNRNAFMYSPSLLWVGCNMGSKSPYNTKCYYNVWLIDLDQSTCVKTWFLDWVGGIETITPVGSKYFIVEQRVSSELPETRYINKVYAWSGLVELDKPIEPVYQIDKTNRLYAINWNSSLIKQLGSCELVQVNSDKSMDFLDKNFNKILTLNISDLFPDYKPDSQVHQANIIINFNANCLVFYEWKQSNGICDVYCWDFTTNSQVKFPQNKINPINKGIYPIRSLTNPSKIRFFINETETWKLPFVYQICDAEQE
jgi:hypothetical protein